MSNPNIQEEISFDFKSLVFLCLSKWHWFVICMSVALLVAGLYIKKTQPSYKRYAEVLIKEDSKGRSVSNAAGPSFEDLGLFSSKANVNNEIIAFESPAIMAEVVKRLRLDFTYMSDFGLRKNVLYGTTLPITVTTPDLGDKNTAVFTIRFEDDEKVEIVDFSLNGNNLKGSANGLLDDTIISPIGKIVVAKTTFFDEKESQKPVYVTKQSITGATNAFSSRLSVMLVDPKSTVIYLVVNDLNIQRADDILSTVIAVYNETWIKDKNITLVNTSRFIDRRLEVISHELGDVDEDISSYKRINLLPDVQAASSMYMSQSITTNQQILNLNTQKQLVIIIRDQLIDIANTNQLLPEFAGIGADNNISEQISKYNALQLQRNNLAASSSEKNVRVISLDKSLADLRKAIFSSIDNFIVTLDTQINSLAQSETQTTQRIAANPSQAKHLLSVERQQKVKEELYLYLLQKREENELSQAFTANNTRIITPPTGSSAPVAPKRQIILLVAFIIGLAIPFCSIYLLETMNVTVRGRKDLEILTTPFAGEIPLSYKKRRYLIPRKPQKDFPAIVVKEGSGNMINEAFRVVRTNLEFIAGKNKNANVIMVSSLNSGAGKTFITINQAMAFAIKGNKVAVIDLDMRKASLSAFVNSPKIGVSSYLSGHVDTLEEIMTNNIHKNITVIPVGTIPPNPTELLFEKRLETMIDELRKKYDYVLIDCPPVEIVADVSIINKFADITLFIIRAGLFNRTMLPEIEKLYTQKRYKNMVVLLNGSEETRGIYGYRYGYRYGYGYGNYLKKD